MPESKLHKELKNRAVEYLFNKSYWICRPEVDCGYYGRYDAWGIKSSHKTMGIEVKVSRADFRNNRRKERLIDYNDAYIVANENYILCPSDLLMPEDIHPKYGLLWFNGDRIINKKKPEFLEMTEKHKLTILIRFLSSKMNNIPV